MADEDAKKPTSGAPPKTERPASDVPKSDRKPYVVCVGQGLWLVDPEKVKEGLKGHAACTRYVGGDTVLLSPEQARKLQKAKVVEVP